MPIYEYECANCHHHLEAIQKMSEAPLVDCPECKKPDLQKLISAAGFQLKGTGWYATDFRNKGKPSTDSKTPSETKKTESKNNGDKGTHSGTTSREK